MRDEPAALAVVLGEAADRGQRGAELVTGVGHEPPHPLLGVVRRRLGLLPGVEGRLDLAQHDVQRPAEAADLGARITLRHPPVETNPVLERRYRITAALVCFRCLSYLPTEVIQYLVVSRDDALGMI